MTDIKRLAGDVASSHDRTFGHTELPERLRDLQRPRAAGQGLRSGAGTRSAMEAIGYSGGEEDF